MTGRWEVRVREGEMRMRKLRKGAENSDQPGGRSGVEMNE